MTLLKARSRSAARRNIWRLKSWKGESSHAVRLKFDACFDGRLVDGVCRLGHGTAVDWWSLGMLLYEMLTGLPPWYTKDRKKLYESLKSAPLEFPNYVSARAQSLISVGSVSDVWCIGHASLMSVRPAQHTGFAAA